MIIEINGKDYPATWPDGCTGFHDLGYIQIFELPFGKMCYRFCKYDRVSSDYQALAIAAAYAVCHFASIGDNKSAADWLAIHQAALEA